MKICQYLYNSMRCSPYQLTISFLIVVSMIVSFGQAYIYDVNDCNASPNCNGILSPPYHAFVAVGEILELFCSINLEKAKANNYGVNDLVILKENEIIDRSHIERLNETTIRLYMENLPQSVDMYYCYMQKNLSATPKNILIGNSLVEVGPAPENVTGLNCVSKNWETLECKWNKPSAIPDDLNTRYTLNYFPINHEDETMPCPNDQAFETVGDNSTAYYQKCTWTLFSVPPYRRNLATIGVSMVVTNKFKSIRQDFTFNMRERMLLKPPVLEVVAKNSTSVTLQWDIGHLQYFPEPFAYQIQVNKEPRPYNPPFTTAVWKGEDMKPLQHYTVSNLHPKTRYIFFLEMRSSVTDSKYNYYPDGEISHVKAVTD